jgi:hypothetical protein
MEDTLTNHVQFIAYFRQFEKKGIVFNFSNSTSVKVTETVINNFKKTEKLDETHQKVKALRLQIGCYVNQHAGEYKKVDNKTIEGFYKQLWETNKNIFFNKELDFVKFEIKRLKKEFSKATRDRYLYIAIPFLDYLKNKLPTNNSEKHAKPLPSFVDLIPECTPKKTLYVKNYGILTTDGMAALIVALNITGSMNERQQAIKKYYGLVTTPQGLGKQIKIYLETTERNNPTKFNKLETIKREVT